MIVLEDLTKIYYSKGLRTVVANRVNAVFPTGHSVALLGRNGAGKSSLLRMIAGLEDISDGVLRIGDRIVNDVPPKDRDIAMVFQNYALYPHMSVFENIAFPLRLAKGSMPNDEITRRVNAAAEMLELGDHLDRKPGNLSGGQRQRVAMGRAIVRDADAFLFDEPLSNLDAKLRGQMRTEISKMQRRLGITTVYVTHDQTEAMTLGDRVVVMSGGVAQQVGTPDELYNEPANLFVAGFIGSPSMNFFPATRTDVGVQLPFGEVTLSDEARAALDQQRPSADLIAGVRPEQFDDASVIDAYARIQSLTFEVDAELVESLGADKYVHFRLEGAGAQAAQLEQLADDTADAGSSENTYVARVSAKSAATAGSRVELVLDTSKLTLFDPGPRSTTATAVAPLSLGEAR